MRTTLLTAVLFFPVCAVAQTPSQILALTDSGPVLAQIDPGNCNVAICPPAIGTAVTPWAGGVAHDPRDRSTWLSDGLSMVKVDARLGCNTVCGPFPAPNLSPGVVVTGLACNEELQLLFVSRSDNTIYTYAYSGCTLTFQSSCTLTVPTNHIVSGLATDDAQHFLFYSTSPWLGPGPATQIVVAFQAAPCVPLCTPMPVNDCSGAPVAFVTGLGFDPCSGTLEITDGVQVISSLYIHPCVLVPIHCCPGVPGARLVGLCVLPATEVSSGPTCFNGSAPGCLAMQHVLRGDPAIGNLGFALDLVNCPASSIAMCFIDIGNGCNNANYSLCSLMPTVPLWASMQFVPGSGCNGFASMPLPLPNAPAVCGMILSTRWAGWMVPGGPADHYVSNCLTWMITGT